MNKPGRPGFIWIRLDCCCRRCCVELDVALHHVESQGLVRGHGHSNGLDDILDIEVKGLSGLGRFFRHHSWRSVKLETQNSSMCPEEQRTTHYHKVVSPSSHICPVSNGCFPLEGRITVGTFLCIRSKYPVISSNSIPRVIRFV